MVRRVIPAPVLVRIPDSSGLKQRLRLPLNLPLLPRLQPLKLLRRLRVPLRMRRVRARQTLLPALRVRPVRRRPPGPVRGAKRRRNGYAARLVKLVVDRHDENDALRKGGEDVNRPRAPPAPAEADEEARRDEEAAGRLHAHHGDAETAGALEVVRRPDLRDVLDRREGARHYPQEVRPDLEFAGDSDGQDSRDYDDEKTVGETGRTD